MGVIFILILISLIVAIGFLIAFMWAVNDGQYEDDYSPSVRMLFDDPVQADFSQTPKKSKTKNK